MSDVQELNINNSTYDIKAKSVVDTNSGKVKFWTGTQAEYDAITTKDTSTLYWVTDSKVIYLGDNVVGNFSGGRNVGEIISSSLPLTDAGLHLLDGSLILGGGIYQGFVDYIADLYAENPSANYFCTESAWQSSVSTYGVCGKFVYDSVNNTVRLPKYSNKIYTDAFSSEAPVVGNGMTLGLTNGTANYGLGTAGSGSVSGYGRYYTGAFGSSAGSSASGSVPTNGIGLGVTTDSDKSGLIAQLSNITTSLDGYYYIVIATSSKTDIQVDIDEIATDLNGKVSIADCQEVQCVVETYSNGSSWYRIYSDGWCEQGGTGTTVAQDTNVVTMLKAFIDTNYTLLATGNFKDKGISVTILAIKSSSSTFDVQAKISNANTYYAMSYCWQACGYIEV